MLQGWMENYRSYEKRGKRTYLMILKAKYNRPTANTIVREKLKIFPLRSGTRQVCSPYHSYSK